VFIKNNVPAWYYEVEIRKLGNTRWINSGLETFRNMKDAIIMVKGGLKTM